jgi:uncharacterized membrane protein YgcG
MSFAIQNRPFATEPITGMMLPDGIFVAGIGKQNINAYVENSGAGEPGVQVYLESVSNPNIIVTPATHYLSDAAQNAAHLFAWEADFSAAPAGKHLVSFIVQTAGGHQRIIKKIEVTKVGYDPLTQSFTATVPEGVLGVQFLSMVGPKDQRCCGNKGSDCDDCKCAIDNSASTANNGAHASGNPKNVLEYLVDGFKGHDPNFTFCLPGYLPDKIHASVSPTPPFAGQYGDLPFTDPAFWKVILCIIALLLLIAAAIAEAVDGTGSITVGGGSGGGGSGSGSSCCGLSASGGGSSYVAAGLLAAAATVATIAGCSDERDPFRLGQDHTAPASPSEKTIQEDLDVTFKYNDAIQPGQPFKVGIDWKYIRTTDVSTYEHHDSMMTANIHTLSKYVIEAPDVVRAYKREPFIIKAQFYDADDKIFKGNQLFVQCYLVGPAGQYRRFTLEDGGVNPDAKANDGTYTGRYQFTTKDKGIWTYYVLAQDINDADPNLPPDEAAQIIGGMLLTGQITLSFGGGTCPLVPDGHVNVIA